MFKIVSIFGVWNLFNNDLKKLDDILLLHVGKNREMLSPWKHKDTKIQKTNKYVNTESQEWKLQKGKVRKGKKNMYFFVIMEDSKSHFISLLGVKHLEYMKNIRIAKEIQRVA